MPTTTRRGSRSKAPAARTAPKRAPRRAPAMTAPAPAPAEAKAPAAKRTRRAAAPKKEAPAPKRARRAEPAAAPAPTTRSRRRAEAGKAPADAPAASRVVRVNRAPVLTLWAAVVAERQGHARSTALSIGRWIAGTLAQSRGRALGPYERRERSEQERAEAAARDAALGVRKVDAFGMRVPVMDAPGGGGGGAPVAVSGGKPLDLAHAEAYVERAFGGAEGAAAARRALEALAAAVPKARLGTEAYPLYEQIRPEAGWGQRGAFDLGAVERLAAARRREA
jgi:hypothetical protein